MGKKLLHLQSFTFTLEAEQAPRMLTLVKVDFLPGPDCGEGVDTRGDVAQQTDPILWQGNQGMLLVHLL